MTFGVDSIDLIRLVEVVMLVVVGVVFILVVLLPLVAMIVEVTPQIIVRATAPHESPPPPPGVPSVLALPAPSDQAPGKPRALPAPEVASTPGVPTIGGDLGATIGIGKVDGKLKASVLRKVSEIVENHPDEAVSILRNWMYQKQ